MAIITKLSQSTIDSLVSKGILEETGSGYVYRNTAWAAVDGDERLGYRIYSYSPENIAAAKMDQYGHLEIKDDDALFHNTYSFNESIEYIYKIFGHFMDVIAKFSKPGNA